MSTRALSFVIVSLGISFLLGCGRGPGSVVETLVPVAGLVMVDGKPAEGVRIRFDPVGNTKGIGGYWAVTDSDGKYTAMNSESKEGLPPGTYQALFSRKVKPDGTLLGDDESPTLVQSMESISPMYSSLASAGLHNKLEVPERGLANADYKMSSIPMKK